MIRTAIIFLCAVGLTACVNDAPGGNASATNNSELQQWQPLLENMADNVLVPTYETFAENAKEFSADDGPLAAYCDAVDTQQQSDALDSAQDQWFSLMAAWQRAEVMQVGPLLANGGALRNRIYSYASTAPLSTCAVDQSVVLAQQPEFNLAARANNSRGLDALEYLLYNEDLTHTCPAQIAETSDWNSLPEAERAAMRCRYARLLADDIATAATDLVNAWLPSGGNYRYQFLNPNPASMSEQLNALTDALFYIEKETKDLKLGVTLGIHSDCSQLACPGVAESPWSGMDHLWVGYNLDAFLDVFTGKGGQGFDDVINQAGFPETSNDIFDLSVEVANEAKFNSLLSIREEAQSILASGDDSACLNAAANPDAATDFDYCSLHGKLKRLTDILRSDFVTIVNVDLPDRSQSDND